MTIYEYIKQIYSNLSSLKTQDRNSMKVLADAKNGLKVTFDKIENGADRRQALFEFGSLLNNYADMCQDTEVSKKLQTIAYDVIYKSEKVAQITESDCEGEDCLDEDEEIMEESTDCSKSYDVEISCDSKEDRKELYESLKESGYFVEMTKGDNYPVTVSIETNYSRGFLKSFFEKEVPDHKITVRLS